MTHLHIQRITHTMDKIQHIAQYDHAFNETFRQLLVDSSHMLLQLFVNLYTQ